MKNSALQNLIRRRNAQQRWIALTVCLAWLVSVGVFAASIETAEAKTYTKQVLECPFTAADAEPVAHIHNDDCKDADGKLICTLPEIEPHTHSEDCYSEVRSRTCGKEEGTGHQHTDACYKERQVNVCGLEENAGHQHSDACYSESQVNVCGMEATA